MRGAAVMAVLLFHGGFAWAEGGYLGVSTFFTLSGFVVTRVLLREHNSTGTVSYRRFWERRVRRLWPASALALILTAVLARLAFEPAEVTGLRGDLLAAAGQVSNWWFVIDARSYSDLFRAPSLVLHTWSLAIEVQLYLLVVLIVAVPLRRGWHRHQIGLLVGAFMLLSMMAAFLIPTPASIDRAYYGTDTRAFELLAGVLVALVLPSLRWLEEPVGPQRRAVVGAGLVAAALTITAWTSVASSEEGLYRGGLWAYALISAVAIIGARARGPVAWALSRRPAVRLGEISYGVYLFHWPIFLWLSPSRLEVSRGVAWLLGVALTLALAALSDALVERPVQARRGAWKGLARPLALSLAVVLVVGLTTPVGRDVVDLDGDQVALQEVLRRPTRPPLPGAPRVGFFGDSTALRMSLGVAEWARRSGELVLDRGSTTVGCGLITAGTRLYLGIETPIGRDCREHYEGYAEQSRGRDLAVYMGGAWDVADFRLPGDDDIVSIGDPAVDDTLDAAADAVADALAVDGTILVWILVPHLEAGVIAGRSPREESPASDPDRIDRYNEIGRRLARERPGDVEVVDLGAWLQTQPGGELSRELRPDGIHFSEAGSVLVADRFLGPQLAAIGRAVR